MIAIVGVLVLLGSIFVGFTMAGGKVGALIQISEFIVIGGAAMGSVLIGNPPSMVGRMVKGGIAALTGKGLKKLEYMQILKLLHDLFQLARREGTLALESHVEHPEESPLFSQCPPVVQNHEIRDFLADAARVLLSGTIATHQLSEILDTDIESRHEEGLKVSQTFQTVGDAMPGFGIVAAVLGVIITMGSIGGKPEEIGHHVGAALVGTFLGVLLAYGIFAPIAQACANIAHRELLALQCVKQSLLAFVDGSSPKICIEFARRSLDPDHRPTMLELEDFVKTGGAGASGGEMKKAA
jgi:chemotaxis protein MotA